MQEISIGKPKEDFTKHLELEGNNRIIFSGGFGTGKTYFLNKFFGEEVEKYLSIRLAPTNYSVSNNDDIFELIKYDILTELLGQRGDMLDEVQLSAYSKLFIALNEVGNTTLNIAKYIPKLNKPIQAIEAVQKGIEKIREKFSIDNTKESAKLKRLAKKVETQAVLNTDEISEIIAKILDTDEEQETVLIIDDLDRIDPEHIFRILNIFSAHIDFESDVENKFGFDRIIMVCDINNLRNIFHAKYGQPTDFSGYIDKFYTHEVFEFDNYEVLSGFVQNLMDSITIDLKEGMKFDFDQFLKEDIVQFIIINFISTDALTIRKVAQKYGSKYEIGYKYAGKYNGVNDLYNVQMYGYILLDFLIWLFGNQELFEVALRKKDSKNRKTAFRTSHINDINVKIFESLVVLLDFQNHNFRINTDFIFNSQFGNISYKLDAWGSRTPLYYANYPIGEDRDSVLENRKIINEIVGNNGVINLLSDAYKLWFRSVW